MNKKKIEKISILIILFFGFSFITYYLSYLFNNYWILNIAMLFITGFSFRYIHKNRKVFFGEIKIEKEKYTIPIIGEDEKW